jgi:hypothetical protein
MGKDPEVIGHLTVWSLASLLIIFGGLWGLIGAGIVLYGWFKLNC